MSETTTNADTEVSPPSETDAETKPTRKYRKRKHASKHWASLVNKAMNYLRLNVDPETSTIMLPLQSEVGNVVAKKSVPTVIRYLYDLNLVENLGKHPVLGDTVYRVDMTSGRVTAEQIQAVRDARKKTQAEPRSPVAQSTAVPSASTATELPTNYVATAEVDLDSGDEYAAAMSEAGQAFVDAISKPYLDRIGELEQMLDASDDRFGRAEAEVNRLNLLLDDVRAMVCSRPGSQLPDGETSA